MSGTVSCLIFQVCLLPAFAQEISRAILGRRIPLCSLYNAKTDTVLTRKTHIAIHAVVPQEKLPSSELLEESSFSTSAILLADIQKHVGASDALVLSFLAGHIKGLSGLGDLLHHHNAGMLQYAGPGYMVTLGSKATIRVNGSCKQTDEQRIIKTATHLVMGITYGVRATYVCRNATVLPPSQSRQSMREEQSSLAETAFPDNSNCTYFGDVYGHLLHTLDSLQKLRSFTRIKPGDVAVHASPLSIHLAPLEPVSDFTEASADVTSAAIGLKDDFVSSAEAALALQKDVRHRQKESTERSTAALYPLAFALPRQLDLLWQDLVHDALHNALPDLRTRPNPRSLDRNWTNHYEEKLSAIVANVHQLLHVSRRLMFQQRRLSELQIIDSLINSESDFQKQTKINLIGANELLNVILDPQSHIIGESPIEASLALDDPLLVLSLNINDYGLTNCLNCVRDFSSISKCLPASLHLQQLSMPGSTESSRSAQLVKLFLEHIDQHNVCTNLSSKPQRATYALFLLASPSEPGEPFARVERWKNGIRDESSFKVSAPACHPFVSSLTMKRTTDDKTLLFEWNVSNAFKKHVDRVIIDELSQSSADAIVKTEEGLINSNIFIREKAEMDAQAGNASFYKFRIVPGTDAADSGSAAEPRSFRCPRYFNGDNARCVDWKLCRNPTCATCLEPETKLELAKELRTPHPDEQIAFISASVIATYSDTSQATAFFAFYENCDERNLSTTFLIMKIAVTDLERNNNIVWNVTECGYWNTDVYVTENYKACLLCRGQHEPKAHCFSLEGKSSAIEWPLHDEIGENVEHTARKHNLETYGKNQSYCFFAAPARPDLDLLYTTCMHCISVKTAASYGAMPGHFCLNGEIQAQRKDFLRDRQASFGWKNETGLDSDQYERLMDHRGRFFFRGYLAPGNSEEAGANTTRYWHRTQRAFYGRTLAGTPTRDLIFAPRHADDSQLEKKTPHELKASSDRLLRASCDGCKRVISFQRARGEASAKANIKYGGQEVLENVSLPISADNFYQAAERSVATDEFGNLVFVVVGMETKQRQCNDQGVAEKCVGCDVSYSFEVYLHNTTERSTTNLARYFDYEFRHSSCAEEFSKGAGFLQVDGRHSWQYLSEVGQAFERTQGFQTQVFKRNSPLTIFFETEHQVPRHFWHYLYC